MPQVETPVDKRSGMPLPIMPDPEGRVLRVMDGRESNDGPIVNTNHRWHPWSDVMQGGDGSAALHNSSGQEVLVPDHDDYHACCSGPAVLPRTPLERCGKVLLGVARYTPEECISVRGGNLQIYRSTEAQRHRLRTSGEIRVISPGVVQLFAKKMLLADPYGLLPLSEVDRFLALDPSIPADAREQERLMELFLRRIGQPLVASIEGTYRVAREKALLAPKAPPKPVLLLRDVVLTSRKSTRAMVQSFANRLAVQRERRGESDLGALALT